MVNTEQATRKNTITAVIFHFLRRKEEEEEEDGTLIIFSFFWTFLILNPVTEIEAYT